MGLAALALLKFHVFVIVFLALGLKTLLSGGLKAPLLLFSGNAGRQLIFNRHHVEPVTLALFALEAAAANAQLFKQTSVELLELLFRALINNDSIRARADDFINGQLPGAEDAFTQEGHAHSAHHQGGELTGFDVKTEAQDPAKLLTGFRHHLTIDHPVVAIGIEALSQGVEGINQDHITHLTDLLQRHPTRQTRQETGQRVVAQAKGHHLAAVDVHQDFAHHAKTAAGVSGNDLGSHQFRTQPKPIGGCRGGIGRRGRLQGLTARSRHCVAGSPIRLQPACPPPGCGHRGLESRRWFGCSRRSSGAGG